MYTDPIADLINRIKNASNAKKDYLTLPYSKIKHSIVNLLEKNNFIAKSEIQEIEGKKSIKIFINSGPFEVKRVSKPGQRIYIKAEEIKKTNGGLGMSIISTSKGLMSGEEAKKQKIGGEFLCEIY